MLNDFINLHSESHELHHSLFMVVRRSADLRFLQFLTHRNHVKQISQLDKTVLIGGHCNVYITVNFSLRKILDLEMIFKLLIDLFPRIQKLEEHVFFL